jgi:hypothetical protein
VYAGRMTYSKGSGRKRETSQKTSVRKAGVLVKKLIKVLKMTQKEREKKYINKQRNKERKEARS